MLSIDDFDAFFRDVHGVEPFPWQKRLLRHVVERGHWPNVLDLPTGTGKTAAMDVALFHLALEAEKGSERRAPMRIAFVVDRRLVVDDAFTRAQRLERVLSRDPTGSTARVAAALQEFAGGPEAPPVLARRLRGGVPREDDWARTPAQPTILCSTVDQVGSRLLFRGYGVSDTMKPVHAGLLGADCLLLLDEAHLAEPFRQTLDWVHTYRGRGWRDVHEASPWAIALLTATPGTREGEVFGLDADDLSHPVLQRRLDASKPARLVLATRARMSKAKPESQGKELELQSRADGLVAETGSALKHFTHPEHGVTHAAIAVVVNRVARARAVYDRITREWPNADIELIIGPARAVDRDSLAERLAPIRTGAQRTLERPLILVATQCIEVGVDIDLDGLITEAASLDALRQRFGRLNRDGRRIVPYAAIIAWKNDVSARHDDPVYGHAIRASWDRLNGHADDGDRQKVVEFGLKGFRVPLDGEVLSPKDHAPVLLPAHLDLLGQTSPVPGADPAVGLFLHGPKREPDAIAIVWRSDIAGTEPAESVRRLLTLVPPRAGEAIELPLWTVRRWLREGRQVSLGSLADSPTTRPEDPAEDDSRGREAFRWKGHDERSDWVGPSDLRPGDAIVVPSTYGGVDRFGWNPKAKAATDRGAAAARPFARRRFAVRVAPALVGDVDAEALTDALAAAESRKWEDLRDAVLALRLPQELRGDLERLDRARPDRAGRRVVVYTDAYPPDMGGRMRGLVLLAPRGIEDEASESGDGGFITATEDDFAGSLPGYQVTLKDHCYAVARLTAQFAKAAGLSKERQNDLNVAGRLHDAGKADARFQAWLHYGDPLGPDITDPNAVLAKSGRLLPRAARQAAGLPEYWRHEALSVRLAPHMPAFSEATDPELVLWLIGSHHGHGRTLFPHCDPADARPRNLPPVMDLPTTLAPGPGPQSLAFDWNGADWPTLRDRVQRRYGFWELARMEAILRLADHRASESELEPSSTDAP